MVYELLGELGVFAGLKEETQKDLKAVLIRGRPTYFAGLNESGSVGDIAKMVRKPRNPVLK
jgi:hypothetical protein